MEETLIRPFTTADIRQIADIYNYYVKNSVATFAEVEIDPGDMAARIAEVTEQYPWLVCAEGDTVLGYAYVAPWKSRGAYRHCVESSVYLEHACIGRGIGAALYRRLFEELKAFSVHSVVAGIALPNPGSVALHEKMGFEKIGHFREVGRKFDRWIDVGYWERLLPFEA